MLVSVLDWEHPAQGCLLTRLMFLALNLGLVQRSVFGAAGLDNTGESSFLPISLTAMFLWYRNQREVVQEQENAVLTLEIQGHLPRIDLNLAFFADQHRN